MTGFFALLSRCPASIQKNIYIQRVFSERDHYQPAVTGFLLIGVFPREKRDNRDSRDGPCRGQRSARPATDQQAGQRDGKAGRSAEIERQRHGAAVLAHPLEPHLARLLCAWEAGQHGWPAVGPRGVRQDALEPQGGV